MRTLLALTAVLALCSGAHAAAPLAGVDVYGTDRIRADQVRERFGPELEQLAGAASTGDFQTLAEVEQKVVAGLRKLGDFVHVQLSTIQYYGEGRPVYVTVDVVETPDRARRMDFLPPLTGRFDDPDGLFALWREYEGAGAELLRKGELKFEPAKCRAFHCLWGFEHPSLRAYEERFNAGARQHRERLFRILKEDRDAGHRGAAAYLLAHIEDPDELVRGLVPSIRDSSSYVRNNVMRVLAHLSQFHPKVTIPLAPILKAIDYADTTDRNKALYVLDGLAARPGNAETIRREALPVLEKLAALQQPNNRDPARSILKKIGASAP